MAVKHNFFALLNRLNLIQRWGLMRNTKQENVMEHSWQVATIAHCLAIVGCKFYGRNWNPEKIATAALYHDCSEIITGDLPTPIKYHSKTISTAYKAIEQEAEDHLLEQLPQPIREDYQAIILHRAMDADTQYVIKAADLIAAFIKCQFELDCGNSEFKSAKLEIERKIRDLNCKEIEYFMSHFVESYQLTLDELLAQHQP